MSTQRGILVDGRWFFARASTQRGILVDGRWFSVRASTQSPILVDRFAIQVCSCLVCSTPERKGFPRLAAGAPQSSCCQTGGNPFSAHLPRPFHPPPASRTFRGYSRLRREITSFLKDSPPQYENSVSSRHRTHPKNAQAHKMTVLRISSYHAGKIPDFSEK